MKNKLNVAGMLPVGTMLHGTYRIDAYLASGGFGNTYLATNVAFNEKCAIKEFFLRGIAQRDSDNTTVSVSNVDGEATFKLQREKFKKEAVRLRKLQSEHIVGVHDLFDENNTTYYVMDYIDGASLKERLKQLGHGLPESEVLDILRQVLDALSVAHSENILHLDLKPANIMLDKNGTVKLIDFGASKQEKATGGATTTSAISYTNGYAPREQMEQNLDKFGPWTDLYALGATVYTLLTNKKPPLPSDIDEDLNADKHVALPMPSVSSATKKLVIWLMSTNRTKRPQSVEEVLKKMDDASSKTSLNSFINNGNIRTTARDENATVIAPTNRNNSSKNVRPTTRSTVRKIHENEKDNGCFNAIIITIITIVIIWVIFLFLKDCHGKTKQAPAQDSDTTSFAAYNASYVKSIKCRLHQGICEYTGYVNENNVPNGEGEAWFSDGRYYKGCFDSGIMSDNDAFFSYPNGDTYKGSFVNDHFSRGRYTIKEDGSFFEGTYDKQGQPQKGIWYDKNGRKIQDV